MSLGELLTSSGSGSTSAKTYTTVDPTRTTIQQINVQMEGFGSTAQLKYYSVSVVSGSTTSVQVMSLAVVGPVLNVSANGAANTGAITTGNITSVGILHSVSTQRLFTVGGYLAAKDTGTLDTSCNALDGASVNPAVWGLLRYTQSYGWQQSTSTDASSNRIWTTIGSGGASGTPAGSSTQVQYNAAESFGADSGLTWTYTAPKLLTIITTAGNPGLAVGGGYIQSAQGFLSLANAWNAFQGAASGSGALMAGYAAVGYGSTGGYMDFAPLTYANYPTPLSGLSAFGSTDALLWASGVNGTSSPNTTIGLNTNTFINAAAGFATSSTATTSIQTLGGISAASAFFSSSAYNAVQTSGGYSGYSLLMYAPATAPGRSTTGDGIIYFDGTVFQVSQNGSAYTPLTSTFSSVDTEVIFNNGGTLGGSGYLVFNNSAQLLTIYGIAGNAALGVANGYIQAGGGVVSTLNAWNAVQGGAHGSGALMAGYAAVGYGSTGGYIDFAPLTYANYPAPLSGLSAFGSTDALLWASGVNGTSSPNTTIGLNTNTFINAASGFSTASSSANAIQAPAGGVFARQMLANQATFGDSSVAPISQLTCISYANLASTFRGVTAMQISSDNLASNINMFKARGSASGYSAVINSDNVAAITALPYDGSTWQVSARIRFAVDGSVSAGSVPVGIQFYTGTPVAQRMYISPSGLVTFGTTVAIDQSGNISFSGIVSGVGASSGLNIAGTAYNAIQSPAGGMYAALGFTADAPLYSKSTTGTLPTPATGYGALLHRSASIWNYYDPTSGWQTVNLSLVGGVSSLGGATGTISLSAGLMMSSNVLTIGQPVGTSDSPTFNKVSVDTLFYSAASGSSTAFQVGSSVCAIDGNGNFQTQSSSTNAVQAPNGGFLFSLGAITNSFYNSFQFTGGGGMSFGSTLGEKIALYDGGSGNRYGLGIQSGVLQIYSGYGNVAIGSGGGSSSFTGTALFQPNGYVGLNTGSPTSQLHVLGGAGTALPAAGGGTLYLQDSGGAVGNGGAVLFGAQQGAFAAIKAWIANGTGPAGYLSFFTQNISGGMNRGMTIFQNGAVTIGNQLNSESQFSVLPPSNVTTPATGCLLTVGEASGNSAFNMGLGYYLRAGATWTGVLQAQADGGATNLTINPNGGYVGIGIENPGVALDVSGYIRGTGFYTGAGLVIDSGGNYKGNVNTTGYVACGPLYSLADTGTPSSPASGYGGMQYYSGSTWWVWNGSSYVTHDFLASSGGVSSLGAATGAITLSSGLTMVSNVLTIGQPVGTANSVSFAAVSVSGTTYNAISSAGGVSAATFYVGTTNVIDGSGNYKGNVSTSGYISCGPVYASTSVTISGPLYSAATSSSPASPASGYGGLQYGTGSSWYIWNGSSYVLHDLLSGGSYTPGTGVNISGTTISIGQSVSNTDAVTFAAIQLNSGSGVSYPIRYADTGGHYFQVDNNGTVGMSGGCGAAGFSLTGSGYVIDPSGNFVSNVNTPGYITTTQAVTAASYKIGGTTVIDTGGNWLGNVNTAGFIAGGYYTVGSTHVIDTSGNYVGPGVSTSGVVATSSYMNSTGYRVSNNTVINNLGQFVGFGINIGSYGATLGSVTVGSVYAINTSGVFVGNGVSCPSYSVTASGYYANVGGSTYTGQSYKITLSGGIYFIITPLAGGSSSNVGELTFSGGILGGF